jgi:hypothetical protein
MQTLSPEGLRLVEDIATRHGVSREATIVLLRALSEGSGYQAQFNHPDLGGMGQWSQGGMTMIGDMFNNGLKHRVDMLCSELAPLVRQQAFPGGAAQYASQSQSQGGFGAGVSLFVPGTGSSSQWWPAELGSPSSTGAQNDMRYACFPGARRLAIRLGSDVRVYDTGEHVISGFSQQQSADQSLTFTSQFGLVRVDDLKRVTPHASAPHESSSPVAPAPTANPEAALFTPAPVAATTQQPVQTGQTAPAASDILSTIERLSDLHKKGVLTDEEFASKKAELLGRL